MSVRLQLRNDGFLPSNGSAKAIEMSAVRAEASVTMQISSSGGGGGGARLLRGRSVGSCPHLAGRCSSFDNESPVLSSVSEICYDDYDSARPSPLAPSLRSSFRCTADI